VIQRPSVRVVAATFDREADANAARTALAGLNGVLELVVHARQPTSDDGPAYAVVVARVVPSQRVSVRHTVARHGGQLVFELDEALGGDSTSRR